jgi:hypothetical protein
MKALSLIALVLIVAACADNHPTSPDTGNLVQNVDAADATETFGTLSVATRNLYLGGDINSILDPSDPTPIPLKAALVWQDIQTSDFPARAEAMAAEFAANPPHVIGVQEAPLFRIQVPGDVLAGNPVAATETLMDFKAIFLAALRRHGLRYDVVSEVRNTDVELPVIVDMTDPQNPAKWADIRFTDRDLLLVRHGIAVTDRGAKNFQASFDVATPAGPITLKRGMTWADIRFRKQLYRVVNTHLETQGFRPLPEYQMGELLQTVQSVPHPVILVGDLNSDANLAPSDPWYTASYHMALQAGFQDTWATINPGDDGFTCCYAKSLDGADLSEMHERIDHIMVRNPAGPPENGGGTWAGSADIIESFLLGVEESSQTAAGRWPSDHRGIQAAFLVPAPSLVAQDP